MQDQFERWMINTGLKDNTAYSYSRAINRLSSHYSEKVGENLDIYNIREINKLNKIVDKYRQDGIYSDKGYEGNSTNRCAILKYKEYVEHLEGHPETPRKPSISEPLKEPAPPIAGAAESVVLDKDVLGYIHKTTTSGLLALYGTILDELRERRIVRSANAPGGDYAELLFVEAFGWTRVKNSVAGYDAVDASNNRYQVKSRRLPHPTTSRQLSALRNFPDAPFDFLAGVLFSKDYSVMRAAIIPYNLIQPRFSKHTNSSIFFLEDKIWHLVGVRDVTQDLRSAATNLDAQSSVSVRRGRFLDLVGVLRRRLSGKVA
jgi:hypothetical protein